MIVVCIKGLWKHVSWIKRVSQKSLWRGGYTKETGQGLEQEVSKDDMDGLIEKSQPTVWEVMRCCRSGPPLQTACHRQHCSADPSERGSTLNMQAELRGVVYLTPLNQPALLPHQTSQIQLSLQAPVLQMSPQEVWGVCSEWGKYAQTGVGLICEHLVHLQGLKRMCPVI